MKIKVKYDWIVLKYDVTPNLMMCERCGTTFEMPNRPIAINMFMWIMNIFAKDHKKCKPKTQAPIGVVELPFKDKPCPQCHQAEYNPKCQYCNENRHLPKDEGSSLD